MKKNRDINTRIITAALVLVNAVASTAHAARLPKAKIATLVSWVESTGKDRSDFTPENALLIDWKPEDGHSKARGAPGKDGAPDRFLHLFSNHGPKFLVLKKAREEAGRDNIWNLKIGLNGKILKATYINTALDEKGEAIKPKLVFLKDDSETRKLASDELDFWIARASTNTKASDPSEPPH